MAFQQLLFSFCQLVLTNRYLSSAACIKHRVRSSQKQLWVPRVFATGSCDGIKIGTGWVSQALWHRLGLLSSSSSHFQCLKLLGEALIKLDDKHFLKFEMYSQKRKSSCSLHCKKQTSIPVSHHFHILPCTYIYFQDLISSRCRIQHTGLPTTSYFFFGEGTVQNQPDDNKELQTTLLEAFTMCTPLEISSSSLLQDLQLPDPARCWCDCTCAQQPPTWGKGVSDTLNSSDSTWARLGRYCKVFTT